MGPTHNIPYLGLCLGMQVMCIELARAFIDPKANSLEFDPQTKLQLLFYMDSQKMLPQRWYYAFGNVSCKLLKVQKQRKPHGKISEKTLFMNATDTA